MKLINIAWIGAALAMAAPTSATTFIFSGGGFSEGATFSGSFTATDLDMNGQISSFAGEVSAFSATFSGNSVVGGPYNFELSGLLGLVYSLDGILGDDTFGETEGLFVQSLEAVFGVGPGPVALCDGMTPCAQIFNTDFVSDFSVEGLSVAVVPEPATWGMMLTGFGAIGFAMRRRRTAAVA